mmetsp:Transcript_6779/g.12191  ORF Transcript_6779/g.12191 Transcript_6779/m.12191 type:complete len:484 (-) Transcript_6779:569-2020(-)
MIVIDGEENVQQWFKDRCWAFSANKTLNTERDAPITSCAKRVYVPSSTEEVSDLVRSLPVSTPIATVGGGCDAANVATYADEQAVVLDMCQMKSIQVDTDKMEITVGPGVRFQALAEAVRDAKGALPIGTGPGVGVIGYVLNGGLSGYFSRRLGLLGQRVKCLEMITAQGAIQQLSPEENGDIFISMLGAGSALGIVTSMTFSMAEETVVQCGGQIVVSCGNISVAQTFVKDVAPFMKDRIFGEEEIGVSMELVVTADATAIVTFVFYDWFQFGDQELFVNPIRDAATNLGLPIVVDSVTKWNSWFDIASSLWPIISELKGEILVTLQHCCGTDGVPTQEVINFLCEWWIGKSPLGLAPMSIIEIRTLGGVIRTGRPIPTGICNQDLFFNLILLYDADGILQEERNKITEQVSAVLVEAKKIGTLNIDFGGTQIQADDPGEPISGPSIFGNEAAYQTILSHKAQVDPNNRFRFHPFASILPVR